MDFLISHSSREIYFITLNLLSGSWVFYVPLSLISRSKMDGILPVHRGSDVISVMFCKLGKFILVDFKKELCPEKDKCCTY